MFISNHEFEIIVIDYNYAGYTKTSDHPHSSPLIPTHPHSPPLTPT